MHLLMQSTVSTAKKLLYFMKHQFLFTTSYKFVVHYMCKKSFFLGFWYHKPWHLLLLKDKMNLKYTLLMITKSKVNEKKIQFQVLLPKLWWRRNVEINSGMKNGIHSANAGLNNCSHFRSFPIISIYLFPFQSIDTYRFMPTDYKITIWMLLCTIK